VTKLKHLMKSINQFITESSLIRTNFGTLVNLILIGTIKLIMMDLISLGKEILYFATLHTVLELKLSLKLF
jgi:hypothetical protein